MAKDQNQADDIKDAAGGMRKAYRNAKKGVEAGKSLAALKAGATGASAKIIAAVVAVVLLLTILTVDTPSTSFNSVTHINEKQDEVTAEELSGKVDDLTPAKDAEKEALNIIGDALKEEKMAVYDRIKKECQREGVDYEATLQYIESDFFLIGEDLINYTKPGTYSTELYDACCILAAYSISVDNLYGDKLEENWRKDMEKKLREYLASDDGRDFYKITYDTEDGKVKDYDGVIDSSNDYEGAVDDYEDNLDEDLIPEDGKEDPNKGSGGSLSSEKDEKDKKGDKGSADLTSVKYIKAHVEKKEVVTFAFEAFGVTNEKVAELYGENNAGNGEEIVREMAMNSLALLHNIEDFEAQLAELSLPDDDSDSAFKVGKKIGNGHVVTTYCLCKRNECSAQRKNLFGVFSSLSNKDNVKRLPLKTCATSKDIPVNSVIYDEDFGLLVVTEQLAVTTPTVAIYTGSDHEVATKNKKSVDKILSKNKGGTRKKLFHFAEGIAVKDALTYSTQSSGSAIPSGQISKQFQMKIVQKATSGNRYGMGMGWCQGWVSRVFADALNTGRLGKCCATRSREVYATKSSPLPIGAAIYSSSSYHSRRNYYCHGQSNGDAGHVGIYIGKRNGTDTVVSMVNGPTYQSLDSWKRYYGYGGWSWNGHFSTSSWKN